MRVSFQLGLMRCLLGLYLFAYYAAFLPGFARYFEPGGMIAPELLITPSFSLVLWLWSPWGSRLLMAALLILAGIYTVGWHARRAAVPLFALHLSFHHANPFVIHEPQQLTNLLLFVSLFLPVNAALTVHGRAYEKRHVPTEADVRIVSALIVYLGVYYGIAGAKKLTDPLWRQGVSLWNLLQWPPFARGGWLSHLLVANPWMARLGTYGALAFEMGFLPLVFTGFRPWLIVAGALFHLGILLTLEVGSFPYVLAPWYALLFDEPTRKFFGDRLAAVRKYAGVDLRKRRA